MDEPSKSHLGGMLQEHCYNHKSYSDAARESMIDLPIDQSIDQTQPPDRVEKKLLCPI